MSAHYDSMPVTGYSEGIVISDVAPISCTEHFNDNRASNTNLYFKIGNQYFNVHPYRSDLGGYPVRWIDGSAPIGWTIVDNMEGS